MKSELQRVKKKKEKIPPIPRLRCFFVWGGGGKIVLCCQDARTDILEATRFTGLMVMERERERERYIHR